MSSTQEFRAYKNGQIQKKIFFIEANNGKDYVVMEQDAIRSLQTEQVTWELIFSVNFPNRDYAKTAYVGRVSRAALEEAGINDLEREKQEKAMYASASSQLGPLSR
jgi:hypothetical protein